MRVIARKALSDYWIREPDTKVELEAWFHLVKSADWATPAETKASYGSASILKGGRVVFNICGNKYRLVAMVNYRFRIVYVRFIGTHKEYDAIDAGTI